ncbi:hypothetical protein C8N40_10693 [Pontibacter mucosus]|uniref:Uncharacterized protein n=1 Tax=Pontibacter mucosus TaxID=1649266 RepID=A0A2T5YG73_9BACT|nr:hypothetical protein [Pontibacter mucosus]PTX18294.1 hypothetical protein C8N40_10693 [Pontibacter mucosus]
MAAEKDKKQSPDKLLTGEQEELLDLYLHKLDFYMEELKAADAVQVEIETQHLKKILHK